MRTRAVAALGAALLVPAALFAADAAAPMHVMNASDIKWGDAPPTIPKGAKVAVLSGDPGKPAPFTMRLQMPANYKIPAHWHSTDENVTVISGAMYYNEGDKLDMKGAHEIKAGGFHSIAAKTHHYAFSKAPTVVQINAVGPFDINYIDPNDDPSKAAAAPAAP